MKNHNWSIVGFVVFVGCASSVSEQEDMAVAESKLTDESSLVSKFGVVADSNHLAELVTREVEGKRALAAGVRQASALAEQAKATCAVRVGGRWASDTNSGASWWAPMATVQAAIDRAQDAAVANGLKICSVWIRSGKFAPPATGVFALHNKVGLYGGFRGNETNPSQRPFNSRSTLTGDIEVDWDAGVVVDAISLPARLATYSGTIAVNNCTFSGTGDAIYGSYGCTISVSNSQFTNTGAGIDGVCCNLAVAGSRFNATGTAVTATCSAGLSISDSEFNGVAGGVRISEATGTITRSKFDSTTGAAISVLDGSLTVSDSVFEHCETSVAVQSYGFTTIENCKFWNNSGTCLHTGGAPCGINVSQSSFNSNSAASASVANSSGSYSKIGIAESIVWGNGPSPFVAGPGGTITFTYSDVEGGPAGTGVLNLDPEFVDPANGDLHVPTTSPIYSLGWGYQYP